jgi:hypothetical protein
MSRKGNCSGLRLCGKFFQNIEAGVGKPRGQIPGGGDEMEGNGKDLLNNPEVKKVYPGGKGVHLV